MGRNRGHIPIRTCISCGVKKRKSQLIRLTLNNDGQLVRDVSGRLAGRGAYICELQICKDRLIRNKRLNRIFRTNGSISLGPDIRE